MWFTNVQNPATDTAPAKAVQASMAVGNLQGGTNVVAGSLGEVGQAMNAANGAMLPGFPWFQADSNFTTPALGDVYGNGRTDIVEGGDSSAGSAYGVNYTNGGHIRVLSPTGNAGSGNPGGGLVCQYNTDQTVQSSPAVGELGGSVGIVFGTGATFGGASTTNDLIEVNAHCTPALDREARRHHHQQPRPGRHPRQRPAPGARRHPSGLGRIDLGAQRRAPGPPSGTPPPAGQVIGSTVSADLTGGGYQDAIVPTTAGVQIFDGKSGALVTTLGQSAGLAFQNSPLVTDDPNGSIGLTIAGYNSSNQGVIQHYEVSRSNGAAATEAGAWPMFHHDPQLTGDTGLPSPVVQVPCNAPVGEPGGLRHDGVGRRRVQLREPAVLRVDRQPPAHETRGRHRRHPRRRRVLARGVRRWGLRLRRRRLPRVGGQHRPHQARGGHGRHPRRRRLLAGGVGRRGLLLRRRRLPRVGGQHRT